MRLARNLGPWWHDVYYRRVAGDIEPPRPPDEWMYVHANSVDRCIQTAEAWMQGFLQVPKPPVPIVHMPVTQPTTYDPLYLPIHTGRVKCEGIREAVLGRMCGDPQYAIQSIMRSLTLIQNTFGTAICSPELYGEKDDVTEEGGFTGTLFIAQIASDMFIMQRANGWPMSKVGWGRLDPHELLDIARARVFVDCLLMDAPQYCEAQASDLMSHLLAGMEQMVTGVDMEALPFDETKRLVAYSCHDTNIEALGGMLGLSWIPKGWVQDQAPPAGELVFELHQDTDTDEWFVRIFFVTLTLEQMAYNAPVNLASPPSRGPISMKHRTNASSFDIPYDEFKHEVGENLDADAVSEGLRPWIREIS